MTYKPPEKTDYNGIPLGGDDLSTGPIMAENDLPDIEEAQVGILQEVSGKNDIPLAGDLLGNELTFKPEDSEETQEETKEEAQSTEEKKTEEVKESTGATSSAFKFGDQDIAEDAKFIIDGIETTAKDVLNIYKTRSTITQDFGRLSQLKQLQKELPEREALVQKQIKSLKDAMTMLDGSLEGQRKFLLSGGIDPYQYEEKIKTELRREIQRESELSEEQRAEERVRRMQQQVDETKKRSEEKEQQEKTRQELAQYQQQVAQSYKIEPSEMEETFERIRSHIAAVQTGTYQPGPEERQNLIRLTQLQGKDLITEVGKITWETKHLAKINEIIDKIDVNIKNSDKYREVMQAAFAEIANPYRVSEPSEEDLIKFLKARFGLEAAKSDSDKTDGSKEESEKADDVEVIKEVPEAGGVIDERPLTVEELQTW